jgi:hypothetical protein
LVLGIRDVVSPVRGACGDRQVSHEVLSGRAMPVFFAVRGVYDVAWSDLDGALATGLDDAPAFSDVQRLPPFVRVPSRTRPGAEMHGTDVEPGGRLALGNGVNPDLSGEPFGRPFARRLFGP